MQTQVHKNKESAGMLQIICSHCMLRRQKESAPHSYKGKKANSASYLCACVKQKRHSTLQYAKQKIPGNLWSISN